MTRFIGVTKCSKPCDLRKKKKNPPKTNCKKQLNVTTVSDF